MRTIKFRAWNEEKKLMILPDTVDFLIHFNGTINRLDLGIIQGSKNTPQMTLMQYTGLKDKNGKEIYEGDFIKSRRGYTAVVEWVDDGRFLGFTTERSIVYVGQEPAVEVIGNIYDNPELIRGA